MTEVRPAHGDPADVALADLRERLEDALGASLTDAYDCVRVWSAWGYGTMREDDFVPLSERVPEIAGEVLEVLGQGLGDLEHHEARCSRCDRHVLRAGNQAATGFLAPCGSRLTRLDECGTSERCHRRWEEQIGDLEESLRLARYELSAWRKIAEEAEARCAEPRITRQVAALREIADYSPTCGCGPGVVGHPCRSAESLEIELSELSEIARAALEDET